jgi:toxin ParE1/3/4
MRVRFTRRATQDLRDIVGYIRVRGPASARKVRDSILASIEILRRFPSIGRKQSLQGVRKHVTRRYLYLVYYLVDEAHDELVILTIRHPSQRREFADA